MNNELFEALTILEKEKNISKDTLLAAINRYFITSAKTRCSTRSSSHFCRRAKTITERQKLTMLS